MRLISVVEEAAALDTLQKTYPKEEEEKEELISNGALSVQGVYAPMFTLADETEAALSGVLRLCNTTQEDLDAVQRHDEAAVALLDINDDDAVKVWESSSASCGVVGVGRPGDVQGGCTAK